MTRSEKPRSRPTVIDFEPRRLREGDGPAAEAARAFHAEAGATGIDEATAWRHLTPRLRQSHGQGRRAWRLGVAGTALIAAAAAGVLVWWWPGRAGHQRTTAFVETRTHSVPVATAPKLPTLAPAPAATPAAPARLTPRAPRARLVLSAAPRALPEGQVDLDGEARVDLTPGGRALASTDAGNTRVSLSRGSVRLDVRPREPGRRFQVESGPFRFVVVGTSFRVTRSAHTVELLVFEGHVAVWRAEHVGPMVAAGEHWTGTLPVAPRSAIDAPAPVPPSIAPAPRPLALEQPAITAPAVRTPPPAVALPAPPPLRPEALQPCEAAAAAGRSREALDCYRRLGDGNDLGAELALYEAARLQLRLTGDVRAALETLAAHARRFPRGALRSEVDLTRIELLPRVGEHRRALEESERILSEHPDHERRRDLRLLRGNIFREALGDCQRAEPEYQVAVEGSGRVADDADFYRAVCVELLGQTAQAASAYQAYLTRPHPAHEADAKKRLSKLQP